MRSHVSLILALALLLAACGSDSADTWSAASAAPDETLLSPEVLEVAEAGDPQPGHQADDAPPTAVSQARRISGVSGYPSL